MPLSARIVPRAAAVLIHALLAAGASLLSLAILPAVQPLMAGTVVVFWAIIFLPLHLRLQIRVSSLQAWRNVPRDVPPSASPGEIIAALSAKVSRLLPGFRVYSFLPDESAAKYQSAGTELFFDTDGAWIRLLTSKPLVWALHDLPPERDSPDAGKLRLLAASTVLQLTANGGLSGFLLLCPHRAGQQLSKKEHAALEMHAKQASAQLRDAQAAGQRILSPPDGLHAISDTDVFLEYLHAQAADISPLGSFRIAFAGPGNDSLSYAYYWADGARQPALVGDPVPLDRTLAGEVIRSHAAIWTPHYAAACRERNIPLCEPDSAWGGLPLRMDSRTSGAMILTRPAAFLEREQLQFAALAAQAGPSLANTLLLGKEKKTGRQLDAFARASRRLNVSADTATLYRSLLESACEITGFSSAALLLPEKPGVWEVRMQTGLPESSIGRKVNDPCDPVIQASTSPFPALLDSLPPDSQWISADGCRFTQALLLPLRRKDAALGIVVLFGASSPSVPREEEMHLPGALAGLASMALENLKLQGQTDRSLSILVEELAALQQLDQELNTALDPDRAYSITLDWAIRHAGAVAGLAIAYREQHPLIAASRGYLKQVRLEPSSSPPEIILTALDSTGVNGGVVLRQPGSSAAPALLPDGSALACIPLRQGETTLGWLCLESDLVDAFPAARMDFLRRIAAHAAIAVVNAKLYGEVKKANQAKNEFISFVAHELKTPMTSIRGYTDLLSQGVVGPVNQQQSNFLDTIRSNADRLANLVSDLNDISRIESGKIRLEFSNCPIEPVLNEVLESLRSQIASKEQDLQTDVAAGLPPVWVDRGRLMQILANLISNAHKYTPAAGSIRIGLARASNRWDPSGPADVVHIFVQDSGLGIAPQDQDSIFQKFFRAEDRSVRDLPGTGLGLHITRNLVELQGGRIWFESELRKGTTFHFTIPVASV